MKKIIFTILFLLNFAQADYIDDGHKAYNAGDKQKASKLYKKACDGGYAGGCKVYRILNEEGVR